MKSLGINHITTGVRKPKLPYSPAVQAGPFVFVSGQASVDPSGEIVHDTFEGEMRRTMENLCGILSAAGLGLKDVVNVRAYVADQKDLGEYNRLYREYFREPFPSRTTLVNCLGTVVKFEIDVVAYSSGVKKR
jgi:2-iminobutanoate/2-iminopropanoate deaminase